MAIKLQNKPNVDAPDVTYPYGNIKDDTGSNDGTPLNKLVHADFHQFFAKILDIGETVGYLTPNGLPENDDNGFQYVLSLNTASRIANRTLLFYIVQCLIGNDFDNTKPYVLYGLTDNGSAIAGGTLFYGGVIYGCGGLAYGAVVNDLQFNQTGENTLAITDSATPGLFQYSDVIFLNPEWTAFTPTLEGRTSAGALVASGAVLVSGGFYYKYDPREKKLTIRSRAVITTLATVNYITFTIPNSQFTPATWQIVGNAYCTYTDFTNSIPCNINIASTYTGAGDGPAIYKADRSDFGALTAYYALFTIDIYVTN